MTELAALRRYVRAAVAIATEPNATDDLGEELAESIIHLRAVRALRPAVSPDINVLLGNAPVAPRARPWRLRAGLKCLRKLR